MTVLVTGASGLLGGRVLSEVRARGLPDRGCGRRDMPAGAHEWCRVDLLSGRGLDHALRGATAVIHCATDPVHPEHDVQAIGTLIAVAGRAGVPIVHVGIAGIEDAAPFLRYYQAKLACERALSESGVAHVTCRATQFHPFADGILERLGWGPVQLCPPIRLQPVDTAFVAGRLVDYALGTARGRVPDVHGPERLDMPALLTPWLRMRRQQRFRLPIAARGRLAAFAHLRAVEGETGGVRWSEWLAGSV